MSRGAIILIVMAVVAGCSNSADQTESKAQVAAALDALHRAESEADLDHFLAAFAGDAIFLGTDASEAWTKADLRRDLGQRFGSDGGWTFEVEDRVIGISDDGDSAWFKEIVHYIEGDYELRPTGTMVRRGGVWRIVHLHMGIPIPNDLHPALVQGLQAHVAGDGAEQAAINAVLDGLHEAAAKADGQAYFSLYTEDGVFFGTDAGERWTIPEFKVYALERFATGTGWTYTPQERHIELAPMGNTAWFDEILWNEAYGTTRGTGALVRTPDGWKIARYHLTIPIPNDLAADMAAEIKAFEGK